MKNILYIVKEVVLTAIVCIVGWVLFKLNIELKNKKNEIRSES